MCDEIAKAGRSPTDRERSRLAHTAIEANAASLFAIDVDTDAEDAYMRRLVPGPGGLKPALVRELHASLEAPQLQ